MTATCATCGIITLGGSPTRSPWSPIKRRPSTSASGLRVATASAAIAATRSSLELATTRSAESACSIRSSTLNAGSPFGSTSRIPLVVANTRTEHGAARRRSGVGSGTMSANAPLWSTLAFARFFAAWITSRARGMAAPVMSTTLPRRISAGSAGFGAAAGTPVVTARAMRTAIRGRMRIRGWR